MVYADSDIRVPVQRYNVRQAIRPMGRCVHRRRPMLGHCAQLHSAIIIIVIWVYVRPGNQSPFSSIRLLASRLHIRPKNAMELFAQNGKIKSGRERERKIACEKLTEYANCPRCGSNVARALFVCTRAACDSRECIWNNILINIKLQIHFLLFVQRKNSKNKNANSMND